MIELTSNAVAVSTRDLHASTILKSNLGKSLFALGILGLVSIMLPNDAKAQELTWNPLDNTGTDLGGSGSWEGADNWFNGGALNWVDGGTAIFDIAGAGTSGSIAVGSSQIVGGIEFRADGFSLDGDDLQISDGFINVTAGNSASITNLIDIDGTPLTFNDGTAGEITIEDIDGSVGGALIINGGIVNLTGDASVDSVTINSGLFSTAGGLADDAAVNNAGTLDVDGNETLASLNGAGAVDIDGSAVLTIGTGVITGIISGDGALNTAGDVTLTAANTLTGLTTVQSDTLTLSGSTAGAVTVDANAVLEADGGTIGGLLTNNGLVNVADGKSINLAAFANNNDVDLANGTLSSSGTITNDGTLNLNGDGTSTIGAATILNGGNINAQGGGTTTITADLQNADGGINITNDSTFTVVGDLTNSGTGNIDCSPSTPNGLIGQFA